MCLPSYGFAQSSRKTTFGSFVSSTEIVGTEPGRSVRWEPSTWSLRLLSKHSSPKCSEKTMNRPWGLKFARCVLTNLAHLLRTLLFLGLMCTEIPPSRLEVLLHPWTTHRRPGIFFRLSQEEQQLASILALHYEISHVGFSSWESDVISANYLPSPLLRGWNRLH